MPASEEMTIDERRKYLKRMHTRYQEGSRKERSRLLSEMEQVTGMHRKSLTRLLASGKLDRHKRSQPRRRSYGGEVEQVVLLVWESLDYICAERLTPALLRTAQHLERFGVLRLSDPLKQQLGRISIATVQRLLRKHRGRKQRLPRKGPERANQVKQSIVMERLAWDTREPGHFEVDLVHHGGGSASGEYGYTLQLIDVATGWSERVALLGRGQKAMEEAFRKVLSRLPFPILHLHPDNGSEFLNQHMLRFWGEQITGLKLSRSRPYRKNDNRFVEQKNDSLVRQYIGYDRLETIEQVAALNALYEQMWLYYNLFQPVMHLAEKISEAEKVRRKWDEAKTPYERLMQTSVLSQSQRDRLAHLYEQTNPLCLRQDIYRRLEALWQSAKAQASVA